MCSRKRKYRKKERSLFLSLSQYIIYVLSEEEIEMKENNLSSLILSLSMPRLIHVYMYVLSKDK